MQCSNTTLLRGSCLKGKGILGGREMRRGAGRGGGGEEGGGGERPARRPLFSCYKHPPDKC